MGDFTSAFETAIIVFAVCAVLGYFLYISSYDIYFKKFGLRGHFWKIGQRRKSKDLHQSQSNADRP